MSPADYELMAYNLQEIKRYVKELKEVVIYYKRVTTYDDVDKPISGETENAIK